jgi:phenol hydroxylase P2 protein
MASNVSITLQNNDDARGIIEAIVADNPGAQVANYPSMIKIDVAGRLIVNRTSVEERIGRTWDVQELQLTLVSMSGNVDEDDDHFILEWRK